MNVIDKTPLLEEKDHSGPWQRAQASPIYGPASQAELEAQQPVIAQLDGVLDQGFTLLRNLPLGDKKIIEPLILVGPPGVFVLSVTPPTPVLDVREHESNAIQESPREHASANPVARVARLAQALQLYLNTRGVSLPGAVEPVLVTASPAVHLEVRRRSVRVVLGDGARDFAASLLQERPQLSPDEVLKIVDLLTNPQVEAVAEDTQPVRARAAMARLDQQTTASSHLEASERARLIFRAAEQAKPFDLADLKSELEGQDMSTLPYELAQQSPSQRIASVKRRKGLSFGQWTLLVIMVLVELLLLSVFAYLLLFGT